jgi:hypothetical protein
MSLAIADAEATRSAAAIGCVNAVCSWMRGLGYPTTDHGSGHISPAHGPRRHRRAGQREVECGPGNGIPASRRRAAAAAEDGEPGRVMDLPLSVAQHDNGARIARIRAQNARLHDHRPQRRPPGNAAKSTRQSRAGEDRGERQGPLAVRVTAAEYETSADGPRPTRPVAHRRVMRASMSIRWQGSARPRGAIPESISKGAPVASSAQAGLSVPVHLEHVHPRIMGGRRATLTLAAAAARKRQVPPIRSNRKPWRVNATTTFRSSSSDGLRSRRENTLVAFGAPSSRAAD